MLANISHAASGWGNAILTSMQLIFRMYDTRIGESSAELGESLSHGDSGTGTYHFTVALDSDFPRVAQILTNDVNDWIGVETWINGGMAEQSSEDRWLGQSPDLVMFEIEFIRLSISMLRIYPDAGGTSYAVSASWEIWGHSVFVAFVPPTDPDGEYVIERTHTIPTVRLGGGGTAVLEWDGTNRSMIQTASERSANVTSVANGIHSYRVWARDSGGVLHETPLRTITFGVGLWRHESLASGFSPDVAFDAQGEPHVCFADGARGQLAYATRDLAGWRTELVDVPISGQNCSIVVDPGDQPHLAYLWYDGFAFLLRHAYNDSTRWVVEEVANVGSSTQTSVAINPVTGEPSIAYFDGNGMDLGYARRQAAAWTTELVDTAGDVGFGPSLAFDSGGKPRIAYSTWPSGTRFASWDGASWQVEPLDPTASIGGQHAMSLVLNRTDVPHVAYAHPDGIHFAVRDGAPWRLEIVADQTTGALSLALDSNDAPNLVYGIAARSEVRYAKGPAPWRTEVIARGGEQGGLGLALSPRDVPSVVNQVQGNTTTGLVLSTRVVRDTIYIHTDANFTVDNGVTGGTGTPNDPFIIEGWAISASGAHAVHVDTTTAPFVVREVTTQAGGAAFDGIHFENVRNGVVERSLTYANYAGIRILRSTNVSLFDNDVGNNGEGIVLTASNGVLVRGNVVDGNARQALDDQGAENAWDGGYPEGGNHWSDYLGVDNCSGLYQDVCPDPDGIGDSPHVIDANSLDRYPLVIPNAPPIPSISIVPENPFVGDLILFNATASTDPDGVIEAYDWDFGDGGRASGERVDHFYMEGGSFRVILSVTDDRGSTVSESRTLTVMPVPTLPLVVFEHNTGFRLPVPRDWSVRQDEVVNGTRIELTVVGPAQSSVVVDMEPAPGVQESTNALADIANETIAGVKRLLPGIELTEGPTHRRLAGHESISFVLRETMLGVRVKTAIVASQGHGMVWVLALATSDADWRIHNSTFELMLAGFEITRQVARPTVVVVTLAVILAASGILGGAVVGLLLRRQGRHIEKRDEPRTL